MSHQAAYLETELRTATPQKLRHLLICGALRFARQTIDAWQRGDHEAGSESLIRCRAIVAELMASVRPEGFEVARTVLGIYAFLFRTLTEAQLHRDAQRVGDVIRVLEEEGETWRLVCEQLPEAPVVDESLSNAPREITATGQAAILPPSAARGQGASSQNIGGFDSAKAGGPHFPDVAPSAPPASFNWSA